MLTVTATAQCILILNVCLEQWRNYNFWPPGKHSLHSVITVLVHNSGSLWTPCTVLGPCPPRHCRGCRWLVTPLVWNGRHFALRLLLVRLRKVWLAYTLPNTRIAADVLSYFRHTSVESDSIYFLFKHQRQRAQATYMPVKSSTMNTCMLNNDTK